MDVIMMCDHGDITGGRNNSDITLNWTELFPTQKRIVVVKMMNCKKKGVHQKVNAVKKICCIMPVP